MSETETVSAEPGPEATPDAVVAEPETEEGASIVEGAEETPADAPYWPEDWRDKMAEHYAAGDEKIYDKERKRLDRFKDPGGVYGMGREAESKLSSGGLIKVPGENASEEDIKAYRSATGVPDTPEQYLDNLELENGAVIGEADQPMVNDFAEMMHGAGASKATMSKALNWYYKNEEDRAATVDENDDWFKQESIKMLKEELGSAYRRKTTGIVGMFQTAPGGTDVENSGGLMSRMLAGRMSDGKLIGDDPQFIQWMIGMNSEINPQASVVDDSDQPGKSMDQEITEIEAMMRTDRRSYFKNDALQERYRELLDARERSKQRR